jgi:hypothetical protein
MTLKELLHGKTPVEAPPIITDPIPPPSPESAHSIMTFLSELLVLGSWFFWVYVIAFSFIAFAASESEDNHRGKLTLAFILFVICFGNNTYHALISLAGLKILIFGFFGYVIGGMIWSLIKWRLHCSRVKQDILGEGSPIPDSVYENYRRKLDPRFQKGRITTWGLFWPWSVVWSLLHESIEGAWLILVDKFRSIAKSGLDELEKIKK